MISPEPSSELQVNILDCVPVIEVTWTNEFHPAPPPPPQPQPEIGAIGITLFDALLIAPVPLLLPPITVNAYEIPLVKPATVIGLDTHVNEIFHGDEVTI